MRELFNDAVKTGKLQPQPDGSFTAVTKPLASAGQPVVEGKRLKQSTKPLLNKLETKFRDEVLLCWNGPLELRNIRAQARRYKLANGLWYKPDFTATVGGQETAWEVKGPHAWRGAFEVLKMAAAQWPEVRWFLVWRETGLWTQQAVLP